ncbi:MAG: hypothetical protein ACRDI1_00805 [Actinomycetota bacterium]
MEARTMRGKAGVKAQGMRSLGMVALGLVLVASGCTPPEFQGVGVRSEPIDSSPTENPNPLSVQGSCSEQYSFENLPHREFAFDGRVAEIAGDTEVVFSVNEWFRGEESTRVKLRSAIPLDQPATADLPEIEVGKRLLVSGEDGFMWGCGFTRPYTEQEAEVWEQIL